MLGPRPGPANPARSRRDSSRARRLARAALSHRSLPCILAQGAEQLLQVRRHRALQDQTLTRARMIESQGRRVQRLALESTQGVDETLGCAARQAKATPIDRVADEGILDMREVQTDLMGAAGFQFHAQIGMAAEALEHPVMC